MMNIIGDPAFGAFLFLILMVIVILAVDKMEKMWSEIHEEVEVDGKYMGTPTGRWEEVKVGLAKIRRGIVWRLCGLIISHKEHESIDNYCVRCGRYRKGLW